MVVLNHDKIITHMDYFRNTHEYVPLVLHRYLDLDYFNRISRKVELEYYHNRNALMRAGDYNKFLEDDLMTWLRNHEEFNDIIMEE